MVWIQRLKKVLNRRKVKLFSGFLFCSFLAWFISNLSESYNDFATFNLRFVNIPEDYMLIKASKEKVDVRIEALGFQLLGFSFRNKNVDIDMSSVEKNKGRFYITNTVYQKQLSKQLSNSIRLLEVERDSLFFDLKEISSKEVPVKPFVQMNFEQNYHLEGNLTTEPSFLTIRGPKDEIDSIRFISTPEVVFSNLDADFSRTVSVVKSDSLVNTSFSTESVRITGKVAKFSEKIIEVPVQVINLPQKVSIKIFPENVSILCKAKIEILKNLKGADFKVVADFSRVSGEGDKKLPLQLLENPENVYSANLVETEVEYILKRE